MTAGAGRARSPGTGLIGVSAVWGVFWGVWGGLLPAVQDQVGASAGALGLALVAIPVGAIPAMAVAGRLARGRERGALATVTIVFGASIAALASASSPAMLGAELVVVGVTSGGLDVCLNMATARVVRETGKRLFQPVHAAFPVAVVVTAPLAGLARQAGVGLPVILLAVAVLVAAVGVTTLRLPIAGQAPSIPDGAGGGGAGRPGTARWLGIGIGVLGACMLIMENGVEQWSALLLEDFRAAPPAVASSGPAVYYLTLSVGRLLAQAIPGLRMRGILAVGAIGGASGIALAALSPNAALTLSFLAITGLAFGPLMPALLNHVAHRDTDGALVAAVTTTSYSGFVASPLIVATLSGWMALPAAVACLGLFGLPLLGAAIGGGFSAATPGGGHASPDGTCQPAAGGYKADNGGHPTAVTRQ